MKLTTATLLALSTSAIAHPLVIEEKRASCPGIHIFGARETTAPAGFGSAGTVVNLILKAHPGATSEAISYPAVGGNSYGASAKAGVTAVTNQVLAFAKQCPNAQIVLVGYSQGGQIMDDAFCGGTDTGAGITTTSTPLSSVLSKIKAVILMGDPRHIKGLPYNVGTSQASGFDPRPAGFSCASASKIQSYCDAADPYCSNGSNQATHQGYGSEYGQAALKFVNSKLS